MSKGRRRPTPLQIAKWKAVQRAKRKGQSIQGIACQLGIHRNKAKKYADIHAEHLGGHLS